jgi:hypothetical protein
VARALSSQNPGARESCLSWFILSLRLSTSKKPPQDNYTVPHNFQLFLCHSGCEDKCFFFLQMVILSEPCLTRISVFFIMAYLLFICSDTNHVTPARQCYSSLFVKIDILLCKQFIEISGYSVIKQFQPNLVG